MRQSQGTGVTFKAPQTRAEYDALNLQRSELRSQLRQTENRRAELTAQRQIADASTRTGIDGRIAALDQRIPVLERQILQADELIAAATGRIAAAPTLPPTPRPPGAPAIADAPHTTTILLPNATDFMSSTLGRVMVIEAAAFLLIGFVAWRYTMRWMEKRLLGRDTGGAHAAKLQQSIDTIAVEVERISENQRYVTKLLAEKMPELGAGEGK